KGRLLGTSTDDDDGSVFSRQTTAWSDPPTTVRTGTNGTVSRFAHPVGTVNEILERGAGTPRRLETAMEYDAYGNLTRLTNYGIVELENGDRSAFDDVRVTVTDYALNLTNWLVRLPQRQIVQDENGVIISRSESFYDDETFTGANAGVVTRGNLTLRRD